MGYLHDTMYNLEVGKVLPWLWNVRCPLQFLQEEERGRNFIDLPNLITGAVRGPGHYRV